MRTIFIDANIPMYWAGKESVYKEPCGRVMSAIASGEIEGVTDTEVFQEILYRYTAIGEKEAARQVFDGFHTVVGWVLPVSEQDILLARRLHECCDVRPRDLVHGAVILNAGLEEICSADKEFDKIDGLKRIDPLDMF